MLISAQYLQATYLLKNLKAVEKKYNTRNAPHGRIGGAAIVMRFAVAFDSRRQRYPHEYN